MAYANTHIAHLLKLVGKGVFITEDAEGLVLTLEAFPLITAGGTNTYTATSGYTITAYTNQAFRVLFTNGNSASSTLNIDSVGAATLKKAGTTNLASGDIAAGQIFLVVYDGTNWQMIGIGGSGGSGTVQSVNSGDGIDVDNTDPDNPIINIATAEKAKLDYISVTQAVDLDAIESRVNELDAAVVLKGGWDASSGTFPGGGVAQAGWSYQITVAGTVDGIAFSINDRIIALTDNASTTTYASNWLKADYSDLITSLDAQTGALTLGGVINTLTAKTSLVDADYLPVMDSADGNASKKWSFANIKANLKTYFDTLYQAILTSTNFGSFIAALTGKTTPVNADSLVISDSADSDKAKNVSLTNFKAFLKDYFDTLYTYVGIANPRGVVFDGFGSVILVGSNIYFEMPRAGTFTKIVLTVEGSSPTCSLDIRKVADGTALPTSGDSIVGGGGTKPTLSTGNKVTITSFTGWTTTSWSAKDTFEVYVHACSNATLITLQWEM